MFTPDNKLIVITGGAGFIGSCLIRHLNDQLFQNIIIIDNLGTGEKWKNLVGKRFVEIVPKEKTFDFLKGMEQDIGAFIHLGACSSTVETDANYLLENNYRFSIKLAEYAMSNDHRFIYASSAATYGDGSLGFLDDEEQLESLRPLNMYGFSKHLFDLWIKRQKLLHRVVGMKYFNVFGPNEYHKGRMSSAIIRMVPEALKTGSIRLFKSNDVQFGDGEQSRDFLYVKDAVHMTVQFLTHHVNGIFNIGSGVANTWNALAHAVITAIDRRVQIEYREMPDDLKGKYQNFTRAEMAKYIKAGLEFPSMSLESSVVDYVRNYILTERYW